MRPSKLGILALFMAFASYAGHAQLQATAAPGSSGGAVNSVSNSDTTLTISPTTGSVIASLNLATSNVWTGSITEAHPQGSTTDFALLFNQSPIANGIGVLTFQPTGATAYTPSSGGEFLSWNAATGFNGYFIHGNINGTNEFRIDAAGNFVGNSLMANAGASRGEYSMPSTGPLISFNSTTETVTVENQSATTAADLQDWRINTSTIVGTMDALGIEGGIASTTPVASATTIALIGRVQHVSGTTAIATITAPVGFSATIGGCVTLIADGIWTTTTAGNISATMTAVTGTPYQACYDGSKWYIK